MVTALQRQLYPRKHLRGLVRFTNGERATGPGGEELSKLRERVVADLAAIVTGAPLPGSTLQRLRRDAHGMLIRVVKFDPASREFLVEYRGGTAAAETSYLTLLLYQARLDERTFPGDLHRCHLEACGQFFFASDRAKPEGGRPSTKFCSPEHMQQHHSRTSGVRVTRHRQRQRAAATKHK